MLFQQYFNCITSYPDHLWHNKYQAGYFFTWNLEDMVFATDNIAAQAWVQTHNHKLEVKYSW